MDVQAVAVAHQETGGRSQLEWLGLDGQLIELQTLPVEKGGGPHHAFVTSIDGALKLASNLTAKNRFGKDEPIDAQGVYLIMNAHVAGMEAMREQSVWLRNTGSVTTDERIAYRRCFYLDFDTKRVNGLPISSTKEELRATAERARIIRQDIEAALGGVGVEEPGNVIAKVMSGNGFQFWFRLGDIPESAELHAAIKCLLAAWSVMFDTAAAHVDRSVYDAKRIGPLAGTFKRKGSNTDDRPHRRVAFSGSPTPRGLTLLELLALVEHYKARLTPEQTVALSEPLAGKARASQPVTGTTTMKPASTPSEVHPYEHAKRLDTRAVLTTLGLLKDGRAVCPACGHDEDSSLPDGGGVKCFRATCPDTAPFFTNMGIVARSVFDTNDLTGDSPTAKKNRKDAYTWLRERFPELPELRRPRSSMLDAILASNDSETSMGAANDTAAAVVSVVLDAGDIPTSDDDCALHFVAVFKDTMRYVIEWKSYIRWNGTLWERDGQAHLVREDMRTLTRRWTEAAFGIEDPDAQKEALARTRKFQSAARIEAGVDLAKGDSRIRIHAADLDKEAFLLNVQNGILDLRAIDQATNTCKLLPHDPKYLLTRIAKVGYVSDATCPTWDAFCKFSSNGDQEVESYRRRRRGSYLSGSPDKVFEIAFGKGDTGKTSYYQTIARVMGAYAIKVSRTVFEKQRNQQHPADMMDLDGVRFAFGAEIEQQLDIDKVKDITGERVIKARGMNENWQSLERRYKCAIYANGPPKIVRTTADPIWNRIHADRWDAVITQRKEEAEIDETYSREAEGILADMVRGWIDFRQRGLAPPKAILDITKAYRDDEDPIQPWIDECCDVTDLNVEGLYKSLWASRTAWLEANEPERKETKKAFAALLEQRGFKKSKDPTGAAVRIGIVLREAQPVQTNGLSVDDHEVADLLDHAAGEKANGIPTAGPDDEYPARHDLMEMV